MKYRAIRDHAGRFRIRLMCRALQVSSAGYYAWRERPESRRTQANRALLGQIRTIHAESRRTYGSPSIFEALKKRGHPIGKHRVARLMRENGIRAKTVKKWKATTDSGHTLAVAPNALERRFSVTAPNRVWAGDITYLWTGQGWLYLAVVLDLYSRKVVGWAMEPRLTAELATEALTLALGRRKPLPGLLHHSDRGVQYCSRDYQRQLASAGIRCSMSRKGNCWDNACVESFFATLKKELIHDQRCATREQTKQEVFEYIEIFYNRQRRHTALGYRSPAEFEAMSQVA